jgi:hypothetical protein
MRLHVSLTPVHGPLSLQSAGGAGIKHRLNSLLKQKYCVKKGKGKVVPVLN